jgi:ribonuclease HI
VHYGDSAVVVNQVNKSWDRNKENMDACFLEVRKLENKFYGLEFHQVVRDNNVAADILSKLAVSSGYVVLVGVENEVVMNRADALAAPAADALDEDFMDFFFPDALGADDPQA